jgi:hypothetical protein
MTTVGEVPTKSKSGLYFRNEVFALTDARLGRHLGLPHSPSNKPPRSREEQFDKIVPGLLGLSGPIKPDMQPVQIKICHWAKIIQSLIDIAGGYHLETSK